MSTDEQYKHLYEPQYIKCERCKGLGKFRDFYLAKMDKQAHHDNSADYLGDGWFRCGACDGAGKIFDPVETWGQDKPKDKK